jgi:tetratricopeptide (TPR) repeat protein
MPIIILILFLTVFSFNNASAIEDIERLQQAIETTKEKTELGQLHKKIGDYYVSQNDYKKAADAYVHALSLARSTFSLQERTQIAIYLSWGGKLKEAIEELELIIAEDPTNTRARVHLARTLSWSGKLNEALKEADMVLEESPDNRDALLIKANVLRWKGDSKRAIDLYKKLLEKEEDFDSRLGLSYAYLSLGNVRAAKEGGKVLKPTYTYQELELKNFVEEMDSITRPNVEMRYSYYHDSDDNRLNRYMLSYDFWTYYWRFYLSYRHTDATGKIEGDTHKNRCEDLSLRTYSKVSEPFGIGGGLGMSMLADGETSTFLTGHIMADVNVFNGMMGVRVSREVFAETAELIENRIRIINPSLFASQNLFDDLSIHFSYNYRDYSDNNHSHDMQLSPRYTVRFKNPRLEVGYRFRYFDFNRQSRSGYFDPDDYTSNQIFTYMYYEKGDFYSYIEPFIGYESFKRYGDSKDGVIGGGYGTCGYKLRKNISFEINGEGGDYSGGTAGGWKYYLIGFRIFVIL